MSRLVLQPEPWGVFNEFDKHGVLLGLSRLRLERNVEYKHRLLDVHVNRAGSDYMGLIYGITRSLGLSISEVMKVSPLLDSDGNPLLTEPAIVFQDTKCTLYSDHSEGTELLELDRWEFDGGAWNLNDLVTAINGTGYFSASLLSGVNGRARSMTIFNQGSVITVTDEDLSTEGAVIVLDHNRLVPGTVAISSDVLTKRVTQESDVNQSGRYYIDLVRGKVFCYNAPEPGASIRYKYSDYDLTVKASPVIIHNLQSDDFKTKMFQSANGELGRPTRLGADIVNELMSVFPASWGA
jgi:hypothetical protein